MKPDSLRHRARGGASNRLACLGLGLAIALPVGLVACGGDDDAGSPQSRLEQAPREERAAPPSQAAERQPAQQQQPSAAQQAERLSPLEELRRDQGIPDFYPEGAPRYPGATTSQAGMSPDGTANLLFGSADSVDEVAAFMADYLPAEGWDTSGTMEAPDGVMMEGTKDGRKIAVMIRKIADRDGSSDAMTMVAVMVDP